MNSLQHFLIQTDLDETVAMNELQNAGIVSDNAVLAADVADSDCKAAIQHLIKTQPK